MFSVQILGSSSATPAFDRNPSAQVVNFNDRYYLIDCGEGSQMQFLKYGIRYGRLDAIFISHMHGDHIYGLPGLLASMSIFERTEPLDLYAPAALNEVLKVLSDKTDVYLRYEVRFHALEDYEPGSVIFQTDKLAVESIPLSHGTFCRGFVFREINKRRKFNFFKAKDLEIPRDYFHLLKAEKDVELLDGRVIRADDVLLPRETPLSYAYCSDTQYDEAVLPYLHDVSVLYHEATFLEDRAERATATFHSTALQAGRIAAAAHPLLLLIGHFSARYRDLSPLLAEASSVFPHSALALEGMVFDIRQLAKDAATHVQ